MYFKWTLNRNFSSVVLVVYKSWFDLHARRWSNTPGCFPQEARCCSSMKPVPLVLLITSVLLTTHIPLSTCRPRDLSLIEQPARRRAVKQGRRRRRVLPRGRKTPSVFTKKPRSAGGRRCPASPALPRGAAALSSRGQQLRGAHGVFQTERRILRSPSTSPSTCWETWSKWRGTRIKGSRRDWTANI